MIKVWVVLQHKIYIISSHIYTQCKLEQTKTTCGYIFKQSSINFKYFTAFNCCFCHC